MTIEYGATVMMANRSWSVFAVVLALFACKSSKKSDETPTTTSAPAENAPKLPFRPSASALQKVCEGQGVPGLDPQPRDKATAALFVKKEPTGAFEHVEYDTIVGYKNNLAVTLDRATLVACIAVTKKKKNKSCPMTPVDKTKLGGTLNIYTHDYVVTLRETSSGKVLSEEKKSRADTQCPDVHVFTKSEEDLDPPFATSADLAVSNYRDGK